MAAPADIARANGRKGGRPKGARNKVTADIKALAGKHTQAALKTLCAIMGDSDAPPAARVAAAKELLDRAHGRPAQAITGPEGGPLQVGLVDLLAPPA